MTLYNENGDVITKITGGNPTTIKAHISDIYYSKLGSHERTFSVTVADGSLTVQISADGGSTWTSASSAESVSYTAVPSQKYDFLVRVSGYDGLVTISDKSNSAIDPNAAVKNYDVATQSPNVDIPEFPTVALPVAAILGLVFIFGRKKEGL
ncbi:PEF-CTERM sorting domain-containing protein [Methanosarcina mazei]|nr:PEF-CTERM sorting domain-containing protein [Methanosarcina mazei]